MPAPSGPRSGKHGAVYVGAEIEAVRNWSINMFGTPEDQVHSASLGGHNRGPGVYDWSGTFEGFGGDPLIFPGTKAAAQFFYGPSTGVFGQNGNAIVGNIIIDSLTINWNWLAGGSLNWSVGWSANGCFEEDEIDLVDDPTECKPRMCALFAEIKETCAGAFAAFPNIESMTLTFTADNPAYSNSDTTCCTYREAGNLDWNLTIVDQEEYIAATLGNFYEFKLYTSATRYWLLKFGLFTGVESNVNIETGAIVTKTNRFDMSGFSCCNSSGLGLPVAGAIVDPSGNTVWPIAEAP